MGTEPGIYIGLRGGPAAEWTLDNPILRERETGWETDTLKVKLGDGVTAWNDLDYATGGAAGDVDTVAGVNPVAGDVPEAGLKTALDLPANTVQELADLQTEIDDITASDVESVDGRTGVVTLSDRYDARTHSTALPIYVYGDSFTVIPPPISATESYLSIVEDELEAPALTTYGLGGRRIVDMAWNIINEWNAPGTSSPVAGSRWPGESRKGVVIVDTGTNDNTHATTAGNIPVGSITTNYREGIKSCYRTLLALVSSGSRIEQSTFVSPTDAWTQTNQNYYSGNNVYSTTTVGRRLTFSVTPPQRGPLAGKVFLLTYTIDPSVGTNAACTTSVDGGTAVPFARTPWEQYIGHSGSNIFFIPTVIPVTVPVDGAAHTVTLTHAGSAGHILYIDACIIPSETPSPILVLQSPLPVAKVSGGWTAAQVAAWKANANTLDADVQSVVAEFGNARWVPTNMTPNGLWSTDGIHPNDRGMAQRANDVLEATKPLKPKLDALALEALPDGDFPVI